MAYVQWPATMPAPRIDPSVRPGDTRAVSDGQNGLTHVRRRFTSAWDRIALRFVLPPGAYPALRDFYETTLKGGSLWFQADWLGWLGYTHHAARFTAPLTFRSVDGRVWTATGTIEVRDAGFADDSGLPSPNHDPNVQSGPISPFEGKAYRFYDDFSTFQGWTLEAGSQPSHDAANGLIQVPQGCRISHSGPADFTSGVVNAWVRLNSNATGYFWGYTYPRLLGVAEIWVTDDADNGYGARIAAISNAFRLDVLRVDAATPVTLASGAFTKYANECSRALLYLKVASGNVIVVHNVDYSGSSSDRFVGQAAASDSTYTDFTKLHLRSSSSTQKVTAAEMVFS